VTLRSTSNSPTLSSAASSQSCAIPTCFYITASSAGSIDYLTSVTSPPSDFFGIDFSDQSSALVWSYLGLNEFLVRENSGNLIGSYFPAALSRPIPRPMPIFFGTEGALQQRGVDQLTAVFNGDCSISFEIPVAARPKRQLLNSNFLHHCTPFGTRGTFLYISNDVTPASGCTLVNLNHTPAPCPLATTSAASTGSAASAITQSLAIVTPTNSLNGPPSNTKTSATQTPTVDPCTFAGCFTDRTIGGHALQGPSVTSNVMSLEYCTAFCKGYPYYGLVGGNQCYCGQELEPFSHRARPRSCGIPCIGMPIELCGGDNRMDRKSTQCSNQNLMLMPN
jgi:hypothetical protein